MTSKDWELLFRQSKANGAQHDFDELPAYKWRWPEGWLKGRMALVKQRECEDEKETAKDGA